MPDEPEVTEKRHGGRRVRVVVPDRKPRAPRRGPDRVDDDAAQAETVPTQGPAQTDPTTRTRDASPEADADEQDRRGLETTTSALDRLRRFRQRRGAPGSPPAADGVEDEVDEVEDGPAGTGELPVPRRRGISAVQFDAPGRERDNLDEEWVELENPGDEPWMLDGWSIEDELGQRYVFGPDALVPPKGRLRLRTGEGDDSGTDIYWGSGQPVWNNEGDTAYLFDPNGALIDLASTRPVCIRRVQFDAPGREQDNLEGEWVEIENRVEDDVDLTGHVLRDEAGHEYTFPDGFTLAARARVQVHTGEGDDSATHLYWGRSNAVWNNEGDTAELRDAGGGLVARRRWAPEMDEAREADEAPRADRVELTFEEPDAAEPAPDAPVEAEAKPLTTPVTEPTKPEPEPEPEPEPDRELGPEPEPGPTTLDAGSEGPSTITKRRSSAKGFRVLAYGPADAEAGAETPAPEGVDEEPAEAAHSEAAAAMDAPPPAPPAAEPGPVVEQVDPADDADSPQEAEQDGSEKAGLLARLRRKRSDVAEAEPEPEPEPKPATVEPEAEAAQAGDERDKPGLFKRIFGRSDKASAPADAVPEGPMAPPPTPPVAEPDLTDTLVASLAAPAPTRAENEEPDLVQPPAPTEGVEEGAEGETAVPADPGASAEPAEPETPKPKRGLLGRLRPGRSDKLAEERAEAKEGDGKEEKAGKRGTKTKRGKKARQAKKVVKAKGRTKPKKASAPSLASVADEVGDQAHPGPPPAPPTSDGLDEELLPTYEEPVPDVPEAEAGPEPAPHVEPEPEPEPDPEPESEPAHQEPAPHVEPEPDPRPRPMAADPSGPNGGGARRVDRATRLKVPERRELPHEDLIAKVERIIEENETPPPKYVHKGGAKRGGAERRRKGT